MDELEIYGSRKTICPLYGEGYHKRALKMLNVEGPRKKQAVAKTRSAATKALVRRNYLASPLPRLPSEIREKILSYLVGEEVVHVQFMRHSQGFGFEGGSPEQLPVIGNLRHAICVAKETEVDAYAQATRGYSAVPSSDTADYHIACCADRHQTCYFTSKTSWIKEVHPDRKFDLAVLGACRQLYEQVHHILWTTNTFSSDDPVSFGKFISSLNPAQLHKLKSFHLSRLVDAHWDDRVANHWAWTIACHPSRTKALRGLRTLHLCIEQWLKPCNLIAPMEDLHEYNRRCIQQDAQPFLQLRVLALEHVTVIVTDNPTLMKNSGTQAARWTGAKKNEMAEEIRVKLLDPECAASLRAEEDAKKLELEGKWLDKRDGVEKRRKNKEERAKAEKIRGEQAEQARTEAINNHLEQQIGGAVRRSWMK